MSTRVPPDVAPPSYASLPLRYYRNSLRPVVLLITAFCSIWGIAIGVQYIKSRNDTNDSTKLKTIYLVLAIMYFACAACEIYGFGAAYLQRVRLVLYYFYAAALAAIIITASEVLRLAVHFAYKSDIVNSCVQDQMDENTVGDTITTAQAQSLCESSWSNTTWWDIALLILTSILSFLFASIAASFAHQLANPSTLRTQQAQLAPSSAYNYPLAPYPYPPPQGPPPPGQQGYYPGQQSSQQYSAPPYAPPPNSAGGLPGYDAGGGAWNAWEGEKKEDGNPFADGGRREENPFADNNSGMGGMGNRREELGSTDTVTLEPRRETEDRV